MLSLVHVNSDLGDWGYFQFKKREFSIQDIIIYHHTVSLDCIIVYHVYHHLVSQAEMSQVIRRYLYSLSSLEVQQDLIKGIAPNLFLIRKGVESTGFLVMCVNWTEVVQYPYCTGMCGPCAVCSV